jgi:uncharacterized membrane protein YgcG
MRARRAPAPPLAIAALAAMAAGASAKELHWEALEVDAVLESDGTVAISELQRMVFTGDWNGGERAFRLFAGQEVDLRRIVRIDPATGVERELERGDLDDVDHWDWSSSSVVRWRSRRPEDPPFDRTRIDYRLDYRLTGALLPAGERRFRLDHDYAFAQREGVIEHATVRLRLRPGWRALSELPPSWEKRNLPPGEGFVARVELEFTGEVPPSRAVAPRLSPAARWAAVGVYLGGVAYFLVLLVWRERALGRFGGARGAPVDRAWLEANVLSLAPEVVGAAWDRNVGSAEVAALLARLTSEGKLASEVRSAGKWIFRREDLHLKLLVDRGTLTDYERALIDGLFGASDTTDTQSVKERYRGTGFDPAAKIRSGIEARLGRLRGFAVGSPKPSWRPTALLLLGGLATLAAAFLATPSQRGWVFGILVGFTVPWAIFGLIGALVGQGRVHRPTAPAVFIAISVALLGAGLWGVASLPGPTGMHLAGGLLWALGLTRATFNLVTTRESPESLARRRELLRAREYFERELRRSTPELEDRWFPYLLAFGLAPDVDRWFRRFGGAAAAGRTSSPSTFGGGSGSSGGGWSGGGGAFGGGGASSSWALAATAMSAGVASPSSSSSGGGGGGSSGGGGGGGW